MGSNGHEVVDTVLRLFLEDAPRLVASLKQGLAEDTLAGVQPWGFRPEAIGVPVLVVHGSEDKMVPCAHGEWLAARCPAAELRTVPDAGHITVLDSAPEALTWLAARVRA